MQLEEAKRAAAAKVQEAELKAAQILAEAEQAIQVLEAQFKARTAEAVAQIESEAKAKAEAEAKAVNEAAAAKVAEAVQVVLAEVLP
jgi:colicin import membrane protein